MRPKTNLEIVILFKMQIRKEYQTEEEAVWKVKLLDLRDVTGVDQAGISSISECDVRKADRVSMSFGIGWGI